MAPVSTDRDGQVPLFPVTTFSRLSAAECPGDIKTLSLASLIITARGPKQGAYVPWEEETCWSLSLSLLLPLPNGEGPSL